MPDVRKYILSQGPGAFSFAVAAPVLRSPGIFNIFKILYYISEYTFIIKDPKRQAFCYSFEFSRSWKEGLITIYSIGSKLLVREIVAGLFSSVQDDRNRTVGRKK